MDDTLACPKCGVQLPFFPEAAGKQMHCHACHTDFPAPLTSIHPGLEQGDYIIEEHLGAGCVSDVFVATQRSTGQRVRMKVMSRIATRNNDRTRECLELAMSAQQCSAPEIPTIIEVGNICDHIYITTPYIDGVCIDQFIAENGPVSEEDGFDLAERLIRIMKRLSHEHQHVHRNLSTGNVLLTPDRELYLLDAGFDKRMLTDNISELNQLDTTGELYSFSAPELKRKIADPGSEVDIYSVGAILHTLVSGEPPISDGEPLGSTTMMIKRTSNMTGIAISRPVSSFVRKAMAQNVEDRPSSWGALASLLPGRSKGVRKKRTRPSRTNIPVESNSGSLNKGMLWALASGLLIFVGASIFVATQAVKPPELNVQSPQPPAPAPLEVKTTAAPKTAPKRTVVRKTTTIPRMTSTTPEPTPKDHDPTKPEITGFKIVAPNGGKFIRTLRENDTISLKDLPPAIAIIADATPATESVSFAWRNEQHTESRRPYSLTGDRQMNIHEPWKPEVGKHKFTATPYPQKNATGKKGRKVVVKFTIVE